MALTILPVLQLFAKLKSKRTQSHLNTSQEDLFLISGAKWKAQSLTRLRKNQKVQEIRAGKHGGCVRYRIMGTPFLSLMVLIYSSSRKRNLSYPGHSERLERKMGGRLLGTLIFTEENHYRLRKGSSL